MKQLKFLFGLALAAISMTSCNSNGFKVEGEVEGIDDGDTLLIMSNTPTPLDTLVVKDGKFEWKGEADSVFLCTVVAPKTMTSAMFFREPGTIHLLLSATGDSKVSGTVANESLQELGTIFSEAQKKGEALMTKIYTDSLNEEQQVEIYTQYTEIQKEVGKKVKELALQNLDNELGYFLLTQMAYGEDFSRDELKETIAKLPTKYQERQAIKDILKMLDEIFTTEVGQQIPDFKMQTPEGQEISIMSLVKQNKITVLDFWASWCQPCREEMPVMKQILTDYQEKGFGIVGISIDDDKKAWVSCIDELQLTWPQMSDLKGGSSNIARSFGVQAIPFTAVIDQQGKVLSKGLRGAELSQFISEKLQ